MPLTSGSSFFTLQRSVNTAVSKRDENRDLLPAGRALASELQHTFEAVMLSLTLCHYYLRSSNSAWTPLDLLQWQENGGDDLLKEILEIVLKDKPQQEHLLHALEQLQALWGRRLICAWDEAGRLVDWAANMIPFSSHPNNPTTHISDGQLADAGSSFTVSCRMLPLVRKHCSFIFCGTSLRLMQMEKDISGDLKHESHLLSAELRPWSAQNVFSFVDTMVNIPKGRKSFVQQQIAPTLCGRPRITAVFLRNLYEQRNEPDPFLAALNETVDFVSTHWADKITRYIQNPECFNLLLRLSLWSRVPTSGLPRGESR